MQTEQTPDRSSMPSHLLLLTYILFFAGLIFSWRAVSSISTGLLIVLGLMYNYRYTGSLLHKPPIKLIMAACTIYFLFVLLSQSVYNTYPDGWRQIQIKTSLVLTPLSVCCTGLFIGANKKKLLLIYAVLLLGACLICLFMAFRLYITTGNLSHFFYHSLVHPFRQHAVYFSLLVFFCLMNLLNYSGKKDWYLSPLFHTCLAFFLTVFLVLLSSKLVICFFAIYLLYYFIKKGKLLHRNKPVTAGVLFILLTGIVWLFATRNPISSRFIEITQGDLGVLEKEKYQSGDYFNGLQFRLLQWKLVPEILNEHKSWWTGTGAGNSQPLLAKKYTEKNMYAGEPGTSETGYLWLNTHNQLLESVLKNGLPAGLLFLFICYSFGRIAWQKKKEVLSFTVILLLLYSGIEAVLETQYGILIFTFFPLFYAQD
jgi:O-antigen ligase